MLPIITALLPKALEILDEVIPDKDAAQKAKISMEAKLLDAATAANLAQAATNTEEAKHRSIFVAGWRPAIGWVCALGLAWNFLGYNLAQWAFAVFGRGDVAVPPLSGDNLIELTFAMLGMAGLRTYEKFKGVTK